MIFVKTKMPGYCFPLLALLVKLYRDIQDKNYYYFDLDSFEREQVGRNIGFFNEPEEYQIEMWLRLLGRDGYNLLYLGAMLALQKDDMRYLDDALYTVTTLEQLSMMSTDWDLLSVLLSANRFDDIERLFPKENVQSKIGGGWLINLVMYLYYGEEAWRAEAVDTGRRYSGSKTTIEGKAVVDCLLSLVDKDFDRFSVELDNICKGKRRSNEFGENKFTKQFPFFALGLYNFARFLYGEEVEKIALPDDAGALIELHEYQKANGYATGKHIMDFKESLPLLDALLNIELPTIHLEYVKKGKGYIDIDRYKREITERAIEIYSRK